MKTVAARRSVALLALPLLAACSVTARIERAAAGCQSGKQESCKQLEDFAKGKPDPTQEDRAIQILATDKLTDQAALGRLAVHFVETDFPVGCEVAVGRLSDAAALLKVFELTCTRPGFWSPCAEKAGKAVETLDDKALFDLALRTDVQCSYRYEGVAVERFTDEDRLLQLVKKGHSRGAHTVAPAVDKIDDQERLASIATDASLDVQLRWRAIDRLTDRQLLARLRREKPLEAHAASRLEALAR